jgi:hypothetical protein
LFGSRKNMWYSSRKQSGYSWFFPWKWESHFLNIQTHVIFTSSKKCYCLLVTWLLSNITHVSMSRNQDEYVNKLKRVATTKEKLCNNTGMFPQVLCICIMWIATLTSTV